MQLFIDYVATKKVIAPALASIVGGWSELYAESGVLIIGAITLLVDRAVAAGAIRAVDPLDLLRAVAGFTTIDTGQDWVASARRLIDILMDGLRLPPPGA
jgi:hypothetical protein